MSVRKRVWRNRDGSQGEAWVAEYRDRAGAPHIKSFKRRRDAERYHATVAVDVRTGIHVPDSQSIMIAEAAKLWLASREAAELERATLDNYRRHVALHITPLIGGVKLSQLSAPWYAASRTRCAKTVHRPRCTT